uniref:Uncharacterized protein n=1 Tax=Rhizophagus irregularis (strain DAOM 181602 / DAOM 197198 / MUCL 43194) TaxID=747089 RepID=U9UX82_RHIID
MVNFLDKTYKKNVTKISEVTDMLTSKQDEQDLLQFYKASSENIRLASCILSKQLQVNASKLTCNLKNCKDSSQFSLVTPSKKVQTCNF